MASASVIIIRARSLCEPPLGEEAQHIGRGAWKAWMRVDGSENIGCGIGWRYTGVTGVDESRSSAVAALQSALQHSRTLYPQRTHNNEEYDHSAEESQAHAERARPRTVLAPARVPQLVGRSSRLRGLVSEQSGHIDHISTAIENTAAQAGRAAVFSMAVLM